jgi:hypothetical protein
MKEVFTIFIKPQARKGYVARPAGLSKVKMGGASLLEEFCQIADESRECSLKVKLRPNCIRSEIFLPDCQMKVESVAVA